MSCYASMVSLLYLTMKLLYQELPAKVIISIVLRNYVKTAVPICLKKLVNISYCSNDCKHNNELCDSHTIVFHQFKQSNYRKVHNKYFV